MTNRHYSEQDIERALSAAGEQITLPSMGDAVAPALARIRAAHSSPAATRAAQPTADADDGSPELESVGGPASITRLEPQRNRRRELALLAGGLAVAAVVTLVLVALFQGLLGGGIDETDDEVVAGSPIEPDPFEVPGYDFVRAYGAPSIPNQPVDVLFDGEGRLLAVDDGIRRIVALTDDGSVDESWGDDGFSEQLRANPIRGAIGLDGKIYVYETGNFIEQVTVLDSGGQIVAEWELGALSGPGGGIGITSAVSPGDIAVDESGVVYVARPRGGRVARFDAEGSELPPIEFEDGNPAGVAAADDRVYVVTGGGSLWRIEGDNAVESDGPDLSRVVDLDAGGDGSLIALQLLREEDDRVARFTPGDDNVKSWSVDAGVAITALGSVSLPGISAGTDDTVYLAASQQISVYDANGEVRETIQDVGPGALPSLDRLAVGLDGSVLALSNSGRALETFGTDGEHLASFELLDQSDQFLTEDSRMLPGDVAASDDHVIVIDQRARPVYRFDPTGEPLDSWSGLNRDDGFSSPRIMETAADGSIYLVDDSNQVKHYSPSGEFISAFGDFDEDLGDIAVVGDEVWTAAGGAVYRFGPNGEAGEPVATVTRDDGDGGEQPIIGVALAVAPDGTIAIVSKPSRPLGGFPATLTILDAAGEVISTTELPVPANVEVDLAFGPDGDLYITDGLNKMVYRYAPEDGALDTDEDEANQSDQSDNSNPTLDALRPEAPVIEGYEPVGSVGGPVLPQNPFDVVYDPEAERIYVADRVAEHIGFDIEVRVIAFRPDGTLDEAWGRHGVSDAEIVDMPVEIALDPDGRLYAASQGELLRVNDDGSLSAVEGVGFPERIDGLAIDDDGMTYGNDEQATIASLPENGESQQVVDLGTPIDIALGPDGLRFVLVTSAGSEGPQRIGYSVFVFDAGGDQVDSWRVDEEVIAFEDQAYGIDLNDDGEVLIGAEQIRINRDTVVLHKFSQDGESLETIETEVESPDLEWGTRYPSGFSASGGRIIMPDPYRNRVVIMDENGEITNELRVVSDGQLNLVRDVQFGPDGDVYAVDHLARRVVRYSPDGGVVATCDGSDLSPGVAGRGDAFTVADDGTIYYAAHTGNQIATFNPDGELLDTWPDEPLENPLAELTDPANADDSTLVYPYNIEIAADGTLLITDEQSESYVKRFSADGEYLGRWRAKRSTQTSLNYTISAGRAEVLVERDSERVIERYTPEGESLGTIPYDGNLLDFTSADEGGITALIETTVDEETRLILEQLESDGTVHTLTDEAPEAYIAHGPEGSIALADRNSQWIWLYEPES